ncbi:MAG: hypothetical protein HGN29_18385 [Asgard group archaeon]|nr:hypothetical protein [Asgard group archaeon]
MGKWEEDIAFDRQMQPYIDEIYYRLFGKDIIIDRSIVSESEIRKSFLDKEFSIDTTIFFENQSFITIQEKSRRSCYLGFNDFTFEYYSNRFSLKKGQWFKLASQLFFYGYVNENETGYTKFYLIDIVRLRLFLSKKTQGSITKKLKKNTKRASNFLPIKFDEIPEDCFLVSFDSLNEIFPKILFGYNKQQFFDELQSLDERLKQIEEKLAIQNKPLNLGDVIG